MPGVVKFKEAVAPGSDGFRPDQAIRFARSRHCFQVRVPAQGCTARIEGNRAVRKRSNRCCDEPEVIARIVAADHAARDLDARDPTDGASRDHDIIIIAEIATFRGINPSSEAAGDPISGNLHRTDLCVPIDVGVEKIHARDNPGADHIATDLDLADGQVPRGGGHRFAPRGDPDVVCLVSEDTAFHLDLADAQIRLN